METWSSDVRHVPTRGRVTRSHVLKHGVRPHVGLCPRRRPSGPRRVLTRDTVRLGRGVDLPFDCREGVPKGHVHLLLYFSTGRGPDPVVFSGHVSLVTRSLCRGSMVPAVSRVPRPTDLVLRPLGSPTRIRDSAGDPTLGGRGVSRTGTFPIH